MNRERTGSEPRTSYDKASSETTDQKTGLPVVRNKTMPENFGEAVDDYGFYDPKYRMPKDR